MAGCSLNGVGRGGMGGGCVLGPLSVSVTILGGYFSSQYRVHKIMIMSFCCCAFSSFTRALSY